MEDLIVDGVRVAGEIAQGLAGSGGNRRQKDTMSEAEREKQRQLELLKNSKTSSVGEYDRKLQEINASSVKADRKRDKLKRGMKKFKDVSKAGGEKINAELRKGGSKLKSAGKGTLRTISTMDKAVVNYVEKSNEKERKRQERAKERRKQKIEEDMQSEEYRQFLAYRKSVADAESEVAAPRKRRQTTKRNTSTKKSGSTPRTSTRTTKYPRWSAKFEDYFDPEDEEYLGTTRARQLAIERYYKRHGGSVPTQSAKNRQNTSTKSAKNRKTTSAKRTTSSRSKKSAAPKKGRSQIDVWANSDNWL